MIYDEQQLKELLDSTEKVVVCGAKGLIAIMLRQLQKEDRISQVSGISCVKTQSAHQTYLSLEDKPISEYQLNDNTILLMVTRADEDKKFLLDNMRKGWKPEQRVSVSYEFLAELSQKDHIKQDFMCIGFTKCGTTSLYQALRKNKGIFMPKEKETLYGKWKNRYLDAPERFMELYYQNAPKKKKLGGVEPTYFQRASFVYESFGKDTKLLFMLRNPADATYSYFKMMMRRSVDQKQREYYKKYGRYCPEMFQDYMQDYVFSNNDQRFHYDIWIKEYMEFYSKEQIKFIFFEDIIKEPERILNEVQKFIGVKPKKIKTLPYSNPGKEVSKNYICAKINGKLLRMALNRKEDATEEKMERFKKFRRFVWRFTMMENNEKITAHDKDRLLEFYADSISEVERLTGKNLKGLWY